MTRLFADPPALRYPWFARRARRTVPLLLALPPAVGACSACPRHLGDAVRARREPASYTDRELAAWRDRIGPLVREGGIRSVGVEPGTNRLRIGVTDSAAACRIARRLRRINVPLTGVLLVREPADEW